MGVSNHVSVLDYSKVAEGTPPGPGESARHEAYMGSASTPFDDFKRARGWRTGND